MNSEEDYSTVEELDEHFSKKISLIRECIDLKPVNHDLSIFFREFENSMINLRNVFQDIKTELKEGYDQLKEMKGLLNTMETLESKLDHMQKNFPAVLKVHSETSSQKQIKGVEAPAVTVAKTVSKQPKLPATIKILTLAEFESVPKYMKGRFQYLQVNGFIDSFNKAILAKYKLMSAPRKALKQGEFKIVNKMKSEETEETKGKYFCTSENLLEYANIKMEKSTSIFLTILRHCNRIKEVRGPGPLVRYVVIAK